MASYTQVSHAQAGRFSRRFLARVLGPALAFLTLAACSTQSGYVGPSSSPHSSRVLLSIPWSKLPGPAAVGFASLWIANRTEGTVARLDARTGRVLATIRIGNNAALHPACEVDYDDSPAGTFLIRRCDLPSAIAIGAGAVWVGRNDTLSVVRIDPATNRVVAAVPVAAHVFGLAGSSSAIWVSAYEDDRVIRIDPRTNGVSLDLPIPHGPSGIVANEDGALVADYRGSSATAIDAARARVRWTLPVGYGPFPIVMDGGSAWVRNEYEATISRIDVGTGKVVATIPVDPFMGADGIDSLAVSRAGVWVGGREAYRAMDERRAIKALLQP